MARQFGGVELVYLVYVLPPSLKTTPTAHPGDAVAYSLFQIPPD